SRDRVCPRAADDRGRATRTEAGSYRRRSGARQARSTTSPVETPGCAAVFRRRAAVHGLARVDRGGLPLCQLCSSSNRFWLACSEGDDAANGIVWRNADGHAVARDYLDAEAAHSAAELGQHLVACITLHAVKTAAVDRDHGALHINQIILAQLLARPFFQT